MISSEGRTFESHSSRQVETLSKSFTHSCLWRFGVLTPTQCQRKLYSEAPLSGSGFEEAL